MRILLIYPEMPDSYWAMKHVLKIVGKQSWYPPLGLMTVAAMLPIEWKNKLVDLNVNTLTDEDLKWADYVFISSMNVQELSVRQIIARCKEIGVKMVAGGPLFTNEYERFKEIDHLVLNEAEITLPLFLEDLNNGNSRHIYSSSEFADVHQTPLPQWELTNLNHYQSAIVQYSRGCPFQCDFCDVTTLFGHLPRVKTPEQIIAEIELFAEHFNFLLFADDNLIGNKKHLKNELLPALIEWRKINKPAISFGTQLTITLADDPELMSLMLEAGFRQIFVGIETPEEESLISCRKRQNIKRDLLENVKRLHRAGFIISGGFIVGFDTDTPSIFQKQVNFIQESGIVTAGVNLLKAPPGTELYERMKREGRLLERFSFDEVKTNFIPKMDPDILYNGLKNVLQNIYSPEKIYKRIKIFLQQYQSPKVETSIRRIKYRKHLKVILRTIFYIGILENTRKYFWKLIIWTFLKKRNHLNFAFINSIMMYQLHKLAQSYYNDSDNVNNYSTNSEVQEYKQMAN